MATRNLLFSFEDRITRGKYWLGTAIAVVPWFISLVLLGMAGNAFDDGGRTSVIVLGLISAVVGLGALTVTLAIGVKRLHDRDKSGWLLLLFYLAPFVLDQACDYVAQIPAAEWGLHIAALALLAWGLLELGFLRGTAGANAFGADTRKAAVQAA